MLRHILPITKEDIAVIKEYIKTNNIKPYYHGVKGADDIIDEICPFLNSAKKCSIYEVRPLICRFFKCNRKRIPVRQQNFFAKQKFSYTNLWAEFLMTIEPTLSLKKYGQYSRQAR